MARRLGWARQLLTAAAVALWQAWAEHRHSVFFPPPSVIAAQVRLQWFTGPAPRLFLNADAAGNLLPSAGRMLAGLALAAAVAVPLGIALGRSRSAAALLSPVLELARAVPVVTAAPVFIAVLGIGSLTEITVIAAGTVWPLLLNTAAGAAVDPLHLETAAAFRLTTRDRLATVIIPAALPRIAAGLRVSLSMPLVLMTFSELAGSTDGIGYELAAASATFNLPLCWVCLVLLGYLLNAAAGVPERLLLRWHQAGRRPAP